MIGWGRRGGNSQQRVSPSFGMEFGMTSGGKEEGKGGFEAEGMVW